MNLSQIFMSFYEWDFIVSGSPAVSGGARTDIINAVKMLRWIKYKRSPKHGSVLFIFSLSTCLHSVVPPEKRANRPLRTSYHMEIFGPSNFDSCSNWSLWPCNSKWPIQKAAGYLFNVRGYRKYSVHGNVMNKWTLTIYRNIAIFHIKFILICHSFGRAENWFKVSHAISAQNN